VFVLCTLGYYLLTADSTRGFDQIVTTSDKTFKVLNDGTKIWLNKESTVSFNKAFGVDKREIILVGEAYFDVAKNARIPLIITAGNIAIEVKGTAFNVNAYQQNPIIEVAMVRGEIAVADKDDRNKKVKLVANQILTFSKSTLKGTDHFQLLSVAPTTILKETKWRVDTLVFRKEKLKDLAIKLEKKYDLTIQIQSEQLKEKRFSGVFTTETVQQALEALKLSYPLTYTISNRLVIIND
ncbi:MAG: FecR family protein, partial [Bacteroidia bacterium]